MLRVCCIYFGTDGNKKRTKCRHRTSPERSTSALIRYTCNSLNYIQTCFALNFQKTKERSAQNISPSQLIIIITSASIGTYVYLNDRFVWWSLFFLSILYQHRRHPKLLYLQWKNFLMCVVNENSVNGTQRVFFVCK